MKSLAIFWLLLSCHFSFSQLDTVTKQHPYKKSMLYSSILPGAGQVRNARLSEKKFKSAYWKVPLIYASLGTSAYFIYQNHISQNQVKQEYYNRLAGNSPSLTWENYDNLGLISLQKQYLNNRDLYILLTLAIYGVQIVDAGVEAHFLNFDISDDVSLKLQPMLNKNIAGVRLDFIFR
jgi:hypothetical protein